MPDIQQAFIRDPLSWNLLLGPRDLSAQAKPQHKDQNLKVMSVTSGQEGKDQQESEKAVF